MRELRLAASRAAQATRGARSGLVGLVTGAISTSAARPACPTFPSCRATRGGGAHAADLRHRQPLRARAPPGPDLPAPPRRGADPRGRPPRERGPAAASPGYAPGPLQLLRRARHPGRPARRPPGAEPADCPRHRGRASPHRLPHPARGARRHRAPPPGLPRGDRHGGAPLRPYGAIGGARPSGCSRSSGEPGRPRTPSPSSSRDPSAGAPRSPTGPCRASISSELSGRTSHAACDHRNRPRRPLGERGLGADRARALVPRRRQRRGRHQPDRVGPRREPVRLAAKVFQKTLADIANGADMADTLDNAVDEIDADIRASNGYGRS